MTEGVWFVEVDIVQDFVTFPFRQAEDSSAECNMLMKRTNVSSLNFWSVSGLIILKEVGMHYSLFVVNLLHEFSVGATLVAPDEYVLTKLVSAIGR